MRRGERKREGRRRFKTQVYACQMEWEKIIEHQLEGNIRARKEVKQEEAGKEV